MKPYAYPSTRHHRRHGPAGYLDVESFRPWLRDEFAFRCVYCLERETWSNVVAGFDLDHFVPVSAWPEKRLEYDNLLYACRACNAVKGDQRVPDPLRTLLGDAVAVHDDGHIQGLSRPARRLIDLMQLDRPAYVARRRLLQRILAVAQTGDWVLYRTLLGFPNALPDLSRLRPPSNSKPRGVEQSFFTQRLRGQLAETY